MVDKCYAVYDKKLFEYGKIVCARNDEHIRRIAVDTLVGSGSEYEKHPDDFDVYCVGSFNSESGELSVEPPHFVCNLGELLGKEK